MAAESVPETLNGHATNLSADALIKLFYDMPAAYRNRGAWMMSGPTLGVIRTLKDGQGNYIWRPGLAEGAPETILGRPIAEAVDMPAVAANAFPVVFGDFSRAFRIYDRVGLSILRDPYTLATKGMIRFHARRRVGAALVLKEAIRKLKMATA
jgi:HK97 family phage major capsid protein